MGKPTVISLGGSLIAPGNIDTVFLKKFRKIILDHAKNGKKFIIICGGGKTARKYQESAKDVCGITGDDADWIGIHATRLNAHLLRTIFRGHAHPNIMKDPRKKLKTDRNIIIASGWKPGFSTDYDAVMLAKNFSAKTVINMSNIDHVYTKDPKKFRDARPIKSLGWPEFMRLIPIKWSPGLNAPFDPVASRKAWEFGLSVVIIGRNIKNLEKCISGGKFSGTVIK